MVYISFYRTSCSVSEWFVKDVKSWKLIPGFPSWAPNTLVCLLTVNK